MSGRKAGVGGENREELVGPAEEASPRVGQVFSPGVEAGREGLGEG